MSGPVEQDATRRLQPSGPASGNARLRLVIFGASAFGTHPLPEEGSVTIGRANEADVKVHDDSISRLHATLHVGERLSLEDLGSSNGTKVRGVPVPPKSTVELAPGDLIEMGLFTLVVQRIASSSRVRRLWPHGYLEAHLEEECARGGTFSLLRIGVPEGSDLAAVQAAIHEHMGSLDVAASYGPGQYELLLLDAGAERADEIAGAIALALGRRKIRIKTGVASHPRDGRSPDALLAVAEAQVRGGGASPADGASAPLLLDPGMRALYQSVERIAAGDIPVLLLGETGSGKEVLAAHVHASSPRKDAPFVKLNCAAFTETLLESELFGHEKGSFTGATGPKAGLIETAHKGTLFLDEIGELPASMQAKLLRVLEDKVVLRVGSVKPKPVDIRLVSATNRDLEAEVARGAFRRDLYFRVNGVSFHIPPLRERQAEIEPLARRFLAEARRREGRKDVPDLSPEAAELLRRYYWPGNIRELKNMMERASLLCGGASIAAEHLPVEKMSTTPLVPSARDTRRADKLPKDPAEEKKRILDALESCEGNQTRAAEMLGISRRTLVYRLTEYGYTKPRGTKADE